MIAEGIDRAIKCTGIYEHNEETCQLFYEIITVSPKIINTNISLGTALRVS